MVFEFAQSLLHTDFPLPISIGALILLRSTSVVVPPVPGFPVDLVAIHMFGPVAGLAIGETGIMLGATVAFTTARLARSISACQANRRLKRLAAVLASFGSVASHNKMREQFFSWFLIRLLTNPLFDPICYAAGLTSTRFRSFFLGTLLGNLPSMAVLYFLEGSPISSSELVLTTALFLIALWALAECWLRRATTR